MANVWLAHMQQGFKPKHEAMPRMEEAAKKALEINENIAEVHSLLAGVKCNHYWDWKGAGVEYQRVFELNPNYSLAHAYYSHYLAITGEMEQGLAHAELAIKLDPFNMLYQAVYGMALKNARKYQAADSSLLKTIEKSPNDRIALPALWTLYHKLGKYDSALEVAKRLYKAKGYDEALQLIQQYEKEEDYASIMLRLAKLMIDRRVLAYVTPFQIATLFTRAGYVDKAVEWLEKAFEARDPNMIYINIDPLFDGLRENRDFKNILRLMKFP
jgi:tetratricopeptide (TPR) repeat protein